jgi:hypothetical protein
LNCNRFGCPAQACSGGDTPEQRAARRIGGFGTHVEWPAIVEHLGVWTLLGVPEDDVLEAAGFSTRRRAVHV